MVEWRIHEGTLYEYISRIFQKYGWKSYQLTGACGKEPDLVVEREGVKVVSEVKIDTERKLLEAICDANLKARRLGAANSMALLFPNYVRDIHPTELERVYPNLEVSTLILTDWLSDRIPAHGFTTLEEAVRALTESYEAWVAKRVAVTSYDFFVDASREAIREIASILRRQMAKKAIKESAKAVVGRFDLFRILVQESISAFGMTEIEKGMEIEAEEFIADISSYIFVNQIIFYHILSEKLGYKPLPEVDLFNPSVTLLDEIEKLFESVRDRYSHIFGLNVFPLLRRVEGVVPQIARFVYSIKALRPQHIREDLFGRLYHETIPPETRKNLGAFYTKPEAAKLLSYLAIDRWDEKVLDPACGSGTILVEAYKRKRRLSPPMDESELHRRLLGQLYGIDIMHFAYHMTSINLSSQNMFVEAKPNVVPGDGIIAMWQPIGDCPLKDEAITRWIAEISSAEIPRDFDLVMMNPPFTRRERMPKDMRENLKRLIPVVRGRTGYWAYFIVAADNVLKRSGRMALVAPEGFFDWEGQSVRFFLLEKGYKPELIIKSATEFFSEQAAFRDYLVVLKKGGEEISDISVICLKKELKGVNIEEVADRIKDFAASKLLEREEESFFAIKQPKEMFKKYCLNLKPLIAFNTIEGFKLFSKLIEDLKEFPTLKDIGASIFQYNPGFYRAKDEAVADYARKLFASRYEARAPSLVFNVEVERGNVFFRRIGGTERFRVDLGQIVPSLRSYAGVKHMDITGEEEYALVDPKVLDENIRKLTGLVDGDKLVKACEDIRKAYEDRAGNILLGRRVWLQTVYYLAYYSENKVTGTAVLLNMDTNLPKDLKRALTLYLNSSFTLIQLLALLAETRGAWVDLHEEPIWAMVRVPDLSKLQTSVVEKAVEVFKEVGKRDASSLWQRIKKKDEMQKKIDVVCAEMLGLEGWKDRVEEIYTVIDRELQTLAEISERTKISKKKGKEKREEKVIQLTFDEL
jgi:type I restriction-modification system DNA methylase subunit